MIKDLIIRKLICSKIHNKEMLEECKKLQNTMMMMLTKKNEKLYNISYKNLIVFLILNKLIIHNL